MFSLAINHTVTHAYLMLTTVDLSCVKAYAILNIIYMVNNEFIYEQQAQALDLCLRITIGPIFFLPAPAFLLRYYRDHFRKFKGSSNSSGRNNGSAARTWGSSNNHFSSSVAKSDSPHPTSSFAMSPTTTRVDSRLGECSTTQGSFDANHAHPSKSKDLTSPSGVYGRLKLFQTRDRGLSVESSRVLSKDFECESRQSNNPSEDRPDSYHQYYTSNDLNPHPLHNSAAVNDSEACQELKEGVNSPSHSNHQPYTVNIPQTPKPALTQQPVRPARSSSRTAARSDFGEMPRSSIEPMVSAQRPVAKTEGKVP